jgi:hypothetical protein
MKFTSDSPGANLTTSFQTNPIDLKDLMKECHEGKLQLPDFQRGWVWDQDRIIDLLSSISEGFPVGALMTLDASGEVSFAVRPVEGAPIPEKPLEAYLLDGQQRMTSLYQSTYSPGPVATQTAKKRPIKVHFYFDIKAALDANVLRSEAIIPVPEDRIIKENFGRDVKLDLSKPQSEFDALYFPVNRIFDAFIWQQQATDWVYEAPQERMDHLKLINSFMQDVVNNFTAYRVPVIKLGKNTSRAAVCLVFEKVNTGGKPLDAFELVTAMYASDEFHLRDDWKARRERMIKHKVLAKRPSLCCTPRNDVIRPLRKSWSRLPSVPREIVSSRFRFKPTRRGQTRSRQRWARMPCAKPFCLRTQRKTITAKRNWKRQPESLSEFRSSFLRKKALHDPPGFHQQMAQY